ncbi:hypothetical protein WOLCODRAFT_136827 [Wolfiporia cocos MD-104 SS10]|uniref:Uncharacterized protein n=1 Tax=Wolfiporia cocos (strain MD-104) TaxID=742152 RepID=A0A2H3JRH3_WOLCO|nr:hypothetical protein WOLCODRAFT_136827 [Wolfiporia cocos MD-104 SS10]
MQLHGRVARYCVPQMLELRAELAAKSCEGMALPHSGDPGRSATPAKRGLRFLRLRLALLRQFSDVPRVSHDEDCRRSSEGDAGRTPRDQIGWSRLRRDSRVG